MEWFISKIRNIIKAGFENIISWLPLYYESLDDLPIYNWFQIMEGRLNYLWKRDWKYTPFFFNIIAFKLVFQFERLDLTLLRKKAEYQALLSQAIRRKDKSKQFQADQLKKEIDLQEKEHNKNLSLNEFIDYIETSKIVDYQIYPKKISTSRAYSLFWKAIDKNKQLNERNRKYEDVSY